MATIQQMLDRSKNARDGIAIQMPKIVERNKEKILDLNRLDQLNKGRNNDGNLIGRYSKATESIGIFLKLMGQNITIKREGDPFDFKQTGEFFRGFELDYGGGIIDIFSTDSKTPLLEAKYRKLFGLTPENQVILNYEILKPELAAFIKRTLDG